MHRTEKLEAGIYTDEDVTPLLARDLRREGYEALSALEAEMLGKEDDEQLYFAIEREFCIVTHNSTEFPIYHSKNTDSGRAHFGIIIAPQVSYRELRRMMLRCLNTLGADDLRNQLVYLTRFREGE